MDRFEEEELIKKKAIVKNNRCNTCNWFINYFLGSAKRTVGGVKDKIINLFKTTTTRDYSKPKRPGNLYGGGKKPNK